MSAGRTRYVQQGDLWLPERRVVSGLGDWVSSLTKKLGIRECGGCASRRATLNRWVPFGDSQRQRGMMPAISGGVGHPYFNSAEPGCVVVSGAPTNPNYLVCDDFAHGYWYQTCNDPALPANNGWLGCNGVRVTGSATAICGSAGPAGANCAAVSTSNTSEGGNAALGMHGFYPSLSGYGHFFIRFYLFLVAGYQVNDNQKFFSLIDTAYDGGIVQGGIGRSTNNFQACPAWTCNELNEGYLGQNQGVNLIFTTGRWYFVEWEVQINTFNARNGIWRMWSNDCGVNGLGCTGQPTLRASYTNVGWIGGATANAPLVKSLWMDIWGNPTDVGTRRIGLMVASKSQIGFAGAAPPPADILATVGTYNVTGAIATLTPTPGPTLIGFVHRA